MHHVTTTGLTSLIDRNNALALAKTCEIMNGLMK